MKISSEVVKAILEFILVLIKIGESQSSAISKASLKFNIPEEQIKKML
ncbi:MAG: hypothetical protein R3Y29_07860 [bacterium]